MKYCALRMDGSGFVSPFSGNGLEPEPGERVILLVHGYNNDQVEAAESYFTMRKNLDNVVLSCGIDETLRKQLQSRIWELYWPGYLALSSLGPRGGRRHKWEPVASAASYSHEVRKARTWVADGLASFLRRIRPSEVFFIAHSLGCRVVLETLQRLVSGLLSPIHFAGFLLMAGAVPVHMLGISGLLGPSAAQPDRRYCLHSWRDAVLMLAFPGGQILSGEVAAYGVPVATGLTGSPSALWSGHANSGLGHGDYWRQGIFRDRSVLSQLCAGIFGIAVQRDLTVSELLTIPAELNYSILPERQLASGRLPGSDWLRDRYAPAATSG
jgi:hypothetical protein